MRRIKKGVILSIFSLCFLCSYSTIASDGKNNSKHVQIDSKTDYSQKLEAFLQSHSIKTSSEEISYDIKKENNYYLITIKGNKKQETKKVSEKYVTDYFHNKNEKTADTLLKIILIPSPK